MIHATTKNESRVEVRHCPVCGGEVAWRATYDSSGRRTLVEFECSREGACDIPSWDPCPLYVDCLERESHR